MKIDEKALSFEESFERLELILEKMQSPALALETSLSLFEEGDKLITQMSIELSKAEKRVEKLLKKGSGDLVVDEEGSPLVESFEASEAKREAYAST